MSTVNSKDGTSIAYDRSGDGPALVLVDGALCSRNFGPMPALAALLAPHFTVYTYDRRGRGASGDTAPYAVEREVEDLAALIQEAGGSTCVYGISSGAALALEAAHYLSGNISKLALYEAPYSLDAEGSRQFMDYRARLAKALVAGQRGEAVARFMRLVGTPEEGIAQMRQTPMWPALEAVAPTLAYDAACLGDRSVPVERAGSLSIAALVMDGGASPAPMREAVRALARAIPGAEYRTLEGQTHDVAAEAIAPVLTSFFAD